MPVKKIVISSGDPAGCGPRITLEAIKELKNSPAIFYVIGDSKIFRKIPAYDRLSSQVNFIDVKTPGIDQVRSGQPCRIAGIAALNYLDVSLDVLKNEGSGRLVTAPLSKEAVSAVCPRFVGHTEYLADHFKSRGVEMMMVSERLKTVLFTRHVNLAKVSGLINRRALRRTILMVRASLHKLFKVKNPRIVMVSFNPHAGRDTFLGREEKIMVAAAKGISGVLGPYPADTAFIPANLGRFDCFICPYHDQGMIAFKLLAIENGVNLTLGLPIVRTSPAHGVAYDIMRSGTKPFFSSMSAAIRLAEQLKV